MTIRLQRSVEARVLKAKRMGAHVHVQGMISEILTAHGEAAVSWLERAILRESRRQGVPVEFREIAGPASGGAPCGQDASHEPAAFGAPAGSGNRATGRPRSPDD